MLEVKDLWMSSAGSLSSLFSVCVRKTFFFFFNNLVIFKLVSSESGHAGFDAPGTQRDEEQPHHGQRSERLKRAQS